jgi:isoquinoline 1-oxidoreductase beta subunit
MIHHRPQGFEEHFFRRSCLISSAAVGGGMVLSLNLPSGETGSTERSTWNALVRIDRDGRVFLTMPPCLGRPGIESSIRMLIAEELEVALNQVHLEPAPPKQGFAADEMLDTEAIDNSKPIRNAFELLGEASATARVMLIATAAARWRTDARSCHAHEGEVIHTPTWRKIKYGELTIDAAHMPIPDEVELKRQPSLSESSAPSDRRVERALPSMTPVGCHPFMVPERLRYI